MELRALLHPYTDLVRQEETGPLVICRAEGARIFDETGKDYIEGMGGLWSASLGFSEKPAPCWYWRRLSRLLDSTFAEQSDDVLDRLPVIAELPGRRSRRRDDQQFRACCNDRSGAIDPRRREPERAGSAL